MGRARDANLFHASGLKNSRPECRFLTTAEGGFFEINKLLQDFAYPTKPATRFASGSAIRLGPFFAPHERDGTIINVPVPFYLLFLSPFILHARGHALLAFTQKAHDLLRHVVEESEMAANLIPVTFQIPKLTDTDIFKKLGTLDAKTDNGETQRE